MNESIDFTLFPKPSCSDMELLPTTYSGKAPSSAEGLSICTAHEADYLVQERYA